MLAQETHAKRNGAAKDRTFYDMLGREILECLRQARTVPAEKDKQWWWGRAAGLADAWMLRDRTWPREWDADPEHVANLAELIVHVRALRDEAEDGA